MQRDKSITRVPWSRHMGVSQETNRKNDFSVGTHNPLKKESFDWKFAGNGFIQRRASSESNLVKGVPAKISDDNGWDSQSDPGSISPRNRKWLASSLYEDENVENKEEMGNRENCEQPRKKSPVQGRGCKSNILRRRKGKNDDTKIGENFVVEMSENVLPEAINSRSTHIPQYVHFYFDFLYYSCVSPYKWDRKNGEEHTNIQNLLANVQKVNLAYLM